MVKSADGRPTIDMPPITAQLDGYFPRMQYEEESDALGEIDEGSPLEWGPEPPDCMDDEDKDVTSSDWTRKTGKRSDHVKIDESGLLNKEQIQELKDLIDENYDVLATSKVELKITNVARHKIPLTDTKPIKISPYRLQARYYEWCREEIKQLLERGLISPSESSYSFPCVIVKKKEEGKLRLCVDYRELNK